MMRWLTGLLMVFLVVLGASRLVADDGEAAADLARARSRLVESTREYRDSVARLLALQEVAAARADERVAVRRHLYDQGMLSRGELDESERSAGAARDQVGETRRRLAETDSALAETLAAMELARAGGGGTNGVATTPPTIGGRGDTDLTPAVVRDLDRFFISLFARSLPVSALGQTPVHDRLGLDHRHALDVAVHPDSEEGRSLIAYLQVNGIAFLAFRGVVPGASTGAHVHVGRASARLVPVSAVPR